MSYVHDRDTGQTELVSIDAGGNAANGWYPIVIEDARLVFFYSGGWLVRDRLAGSTELVVAVAPGDDGPLGISSDGRFVAFINKENTGLVPNDTNGTWDVFVHDRQSGSTERVSVASDGAEGNGASGQTTSALSGHQRGRAVRRFSVPGFQHCAQR